MDVKAYLKSLQESRILFFAVPLTVWGIGLQAFLEGGIGPKTMLQVLWVILGFGVFALLGLIQLRRWKPFIPLFYGAIMGLLILVLLAGKGEGTRRWLSLWGLRLQPSELGKPALALFSGYIAEMLQPKIPPSALLLLLSVSAGIPILLILLEPDLGTAVVYAAILLGVLYGCPSLKRKHFYILGLLLLLSFFPLWRQLKPYQRERLVTFLNPSASPLGRGYQPLLSQFIIASGGILGKGFTSESHRVLTYLPGRQTDFIFASVARTTGLLGSSLLLLLYTLLFLQTLQLTTGTPNSFIRVCGYGLWAYLVSQSLINLAVTMGLAPVTGIPLLFLSYGGSGMLSCYFTLSVIHSFYPFYREERLRKTREARWL